MPFTTFLFLLLAPQHKPIPDDFKGTYVWYSEALPYQFERRITINCDSTVSTLYHGGRTHLKLSGRWKFQNDTLLITLTPTQDKDGEPVFPHWKEHLVYKLNKNKLIALLTPEELADRRERHYVFKKVKRVICN